MAPGAGPRSSALPAPLSSLRRRHPRGPGRPRGPGALRLENFAPTSSLSPGPTWVSSRERPWDLAFVGSEFDSMSLHDTGEWPHEPQEGRSQRCCPRLGALGDRWRGWRATHPTEQTYRARANFPFRQVRKTKPNQRQQHSVSCFLPALGNNVEK